MADSALQDLTKMPNLPLTSKLFQNKPAPPGMIGPAEYGPALSELRDAERQAQIKVGESDIAIEEAKRKEKGLEAEKRAEFAGKKATEARDLPEQKALTDFGEEFGNMAFVPTKETTQDLAGLFSLISIVGMVVGKGNAQLAMSSMNGMLEGYQKGRADLYKKEQIEFDKNFKAMQNKLTILKEDLLRARELQKLDWEKGDLEVTMALAKVDSPVLNELRKKVGNAGVLNGVQGLIKDMDSAVKTKNDLQGKADARADAEERERRADERTKESNRRADINAKLARDQALALANLKSEKGGKAPAKEIVGQNQLRNNLIPKLEEVLPIMERLNKENKWNTLTSLLALDPRVAELEFKNDEEALKAIRTFAYFRSKEFETAGKALTRKEDAILAPIYRSDFRVYQGARGAIQDGLKTMKQEQAGLEGMYPYIKEYNQILRGEVPQLGDDAQGQRTNFATKEEAQAANLPVGTRITINGRNAIVR
jgi:hypothetical protein